MAANEVEHQQLEANGISIHAVSMGTGPLVLFCHGFPESWYSRAAPAPRGRRRRIPRSRDGHARLRKTSAPAAVDAYTISHLVGDVVGTVHALGADDAVVVGHDWGAPVAWYSALMPTRPVPRRRGAQRPLTFRRSACPMA